MKKARHRSTVQGSVKTSAALGSKRSAGRSSVGKAVAKESAVSSGILAVIPVEPREPAKSGELVVVPQTVDDDPMTADEQKALRDYERTIEAAAQKVDAGFRELATAFHEIRERRLYRESSPTFATYFQAKWGYGRSHAKRIADAGEIMRHLAPRGAILKLMTSEAHFRSLAKLDDDERNDTLALAEKWLSWRSRTVVPPALIRSAKAVLYPPEAPTPRDDRHDELIAEFLEMVADTKAQLPDGTTRDVRKLFGQLQTKIEALRGPRSSTGIAWTEATWNPLQGCARVSAGCDRCYAAKLIATRMADLYPGLARVKVAKDGTKSYAFLNKIVLLPEDLGQPLHDLTPKRFFVNSMSDLFHKNVPDDFIGAVFDVMKKAHWHQFQVLTKRPERMATFTATYFKSEEPPQNIWLGTSTEDQEAFDERIPWLRKTKAAVRWLSCEPLLGPIKFDSADGINWVVTGGESDSVRKMEKAWATSLRDQCKKAEIPFFFKQWGDFNEAGLGPKKEKHNKLTPPTIEGVIHNAYPMPLPGEAPD